MVSLRIQLVLPIRNSQKSQYEYDFSTWSIIDCYSLAQGGRTMILFICFSIVDGDM